MSNGKTIASLNDNLRRTFSGGRIMITAGIHALTSDQQARIMQAVQTFDQFDAGNDPYGEHDFGAVTVDGYRILFKIDYIEKGSQLSAGAEEPDNAATTDRVLTIMLGEEY